MRKYDFKLQEPQFLRVKQDKWIRGLNVLVSATQIQPNEVAEMTDCQLIEDGKIQCPRDGQAYYGATNGSRVRGVFPLYLSSGTKYLLRMVGTTLQKYTNATTWTNLSGFTYTSDLNTNAAPTHDRLYLCNGTDPLTYTDGSTVTSFTAIGAANTPSAARTGTNGSFTMSYKITAVTAVGESAASAAGTQTIDRNTLDASNYMTVTWSATTSAVGYNVYGRKDAKWYFMSYLDGNANTTYIDKGQDTPNSAFAAPVADATAGPKGKYIKIYKDTIFIGGDPSYPSRLYYSAGVDRINDFTIGAGGGYIDVAVNDGQIITGIEIFKNSLIIWKEDSIYQFTFTTSGAPTIILINASVGCIAPRSIITVENDVFFMSRRGVFTIGNEPGFAFDVLRTNEISAKVRGDIKTIDPAYVQNVAAVYTSDANKNLVIFSYTPSGSTSNSKAIIYDRERSGWYRWTNIKANCWTKFIDSSGVVHFLYGDDSSGYVKEILTGSNDFGSAIHGYFYLRAESFGRGTTSNISQYKILKDVSLVLRKPSGSLKLTIITDGVTTSYTNNVGTVAPAINFGHYLFKKFLFKTAYGTGVSSADELTLRTIKNVNVEGKTFQLQFDNNSVSNFVLLEIDITAKPRNERYRLSSDLVS